MSRAFVRGQPHTAPFGTVAMARRSFAHPGAGIVRGTVARIAYVSGGASHSRFEEAGEWRPACANVPMAPGDRLYTARGGYLELQSTGFAIWLAAATGLTVVDLTPDVKLFSLWCGAASLLIRLLRSAESFGFDTPNAAVTFERAGSYRMEVERNGGTRVVVDRGSAYVSAAGGELTVAAGHLVRIDDHRLRL